MHALSNRCQRPRACVSTQAKSRSSLSLLSCKPPASSSRLGLRVVAFRDDDSREKAKRAAQDAKTQGRSLQRQVGRNIQKGQQRLQDVNLEGPATKPFVYSLNTVVLVTFAGLAVTNPALVSSILFQPSFLSSPDSNIPLLIPLLRILSLGWSQAAVTNYVQGDGAILGQLNTRLHKRLNASLSTFSVAQLALLGLLLTPASKTVLNGYDGLSVLNPAGLLLLGAGVAVQLYVASVNYARNSPEGYNPGRDAQTWLNDALNVFTGVNSYTSAGYAALTFALLAAGLGYIFAPLPTLGAVVGDSISQGGPESIVLWQLIGAGVSMLAAPAALSLKEAAVDNILAEPRFKMLNIGLAAAGIGHWLVLYPRSWDAATSGPLMPVILGTWGLAAAWGIVNLFSKVPTKPKPN